ncbi:hypothetical protein [Mangrovimonas sp. DI 80]|uniref:hypothetical protein n=1 Tax=Mangrovimonas sp. DI 80 TaxID=1779330 RepID=UPI000976D15D|nr:hypothetical protein [Mangrovimonas sp. DI 80]OMP30529.1 hypothetical protein BKM32_09735 [Mangrovimonas sp. DI 80]
MEKFNTGPFKPIISFRYLKDRFEGLLDSSNSMERFQAEQVLAIFEQCPALITGTSSTEEFDAYRKEIDQVMAFLFPAVLGSNEIKAAVFPYSNQFFYVSERFKEINNHTISNTGEALRKLYKESEEALNLMPYAIILNKHYGFNVDFGKPKQISLQDEEGNTKVYRVTYNADFIDMYPNTSAIEITEDILNELLTNAHDTSVWGRYFPKDSWTVEGFGIVNMIDVTLDHQIEAFKTHLIQPGKESYEAIVEDIRKIFGIEDLEVGSYKVDGNQLLPPFDKGLGALTLKKGDKLTCSNYACKYIYKRLFVEHQPVIIPNIDRYQKESKGNRLRDSLVEKELKSAVLLPMVIDGELQFIIELATYQANQLNAINMVKLDSIMPFILSYVKRTITEYENEVSAVIQNECTSIHPSVQWRFVEEANAYIQNKSLGESPTFHEIVFENVHPLYGQIDVVGSSDARNRAIKQDLLLALQQSKLILQELIASQNMPFYEQLVYQIDKHVFELEADFHSNTEQEIHLFFDQHILPLFDHLIASGTQTDSVKAFLKSLDEETGSLYLARKDYDQTVNLINKKLSAFLDKQQERAQAIFPHYFEKFKTDGIEHNMYVGQSIAEHGNYHESVLYNLRLWQLQVMCEMEAMYYDQHDKFPIQLEVASLILVYDVPLTIRYRIDEKHFDVDGAYNVRYEMIKKRIDKAHIKGTNERLTQPHKLCVVYSSNEVEQEYLNYFEFLQSKKYIGSSIEIVELEELQGASGIKALRAEINPNLKKLGTLASIADLEVSL